MKEISVVNIVRIRSCISFEVDSLALQQFKIYFLRFLFENEPMMFSRFNATKHIKSLAKTKVHAQSLVEFNMDEAHLNISHYKQKKYHHTRYNISILTNLNLNI